MAIFFFNNGFYDDGYNEIPKGAVEVTEERHAELMASVQQGAYLSLGPGGTVVAGPHPAPAPEVILEMNKAFQSNLLAEAGLAIGPLQDAVDLNMASSEETALLTQWRQYRVAVSRVDLTAAMPDWPSVPSASR